MAHTVHPIAKWVAKFTLTGVGYGLRIRVPFVLAEINVAVTNRYPPIRSAPSYGSNQRYSHPVASAVIIVILVIHLSGRRSNRLSVSLEIGLVPFCISS